jgi:hypothetical protein
MSPEKEESRPSPRRCNVLHLSALHATSHRKNQNLKSWLNASVD